MRLVVGMGAVIALLIGQSPVAGVSDTPAAVVRKVAADPDPSKKNVNVNNSTTSGKDDGSSGKGGSSGKSGSSGKNGGQIPPELKNVTSLRVLPWNPRQNNNVRIFVHCPPTSNHAIIGSTAFNLKGSRRIYREVGLGLSDRGLGRRSAASPTSPCWEIMRSA
ncbi:hypothetical protein ACFQX6_46470 [Streptosporangium lutulentum]